MASHPQHSSPTLLHALTPIPGERHLPSAKQKREPGKSADARHFSFTPPRDLCDQRVPEKSVFNWHIVAKHFALNIPYFQTFCVL